MVASPETGTTQELPSVPRLPTPAVVLSPTPSPTGECASPIDLDEPTPPREDEPANAVDISSPRESMVPPSTRSRRAPRVSDPSVNTGDLSAGDDTPITDRRQGEDNRDDDERDAADDSVADEFDRTRSQFSHVTRKTYPAPSAFDDIDPLDNLDLLTEAPWLEYDALADEDLVNRYAIEGWLPGGLPLGCVRSRAWRERCCYTITSLLATSSRTELGVRRDFARSVYAGMYRLRTHIPVDPVLNLDMYIYRTQGEVDYARFLTEITPGSMAQWRGKLAVSQRALLFTKPQLRCEFRYLRKNTPYWRQYVRFERRARSALGCLVPYQDLQAFSFRAAARADRWPQVSSMWSRVEVPQGCLVELPPVITYLGSELIADPNSGIWVVAFTEMVAKTASFIIQEVYDNYRLWALSPHTIRFARELDLKPVLGNQANVEEFLSLLRVIETTDFGSLPTSWRNRSTRANERSPGRVGPGADWVYYDPHQRRCVDADVARERANAPRPPIPPGHPVGYDFDVIPDGWIDDTNNGYEDDQDDDNIMGDANDEEADDDPGWEGDDGGDGDRMGTAAAGNVPGTGGRQDSTAVGSGRSETEVVREFLRECGIPERQLGGTWVELRGFLRGRLG